MMKIIFTALLLSISTRAATVTVGKITREFLERVPEKCKTQVCPLVFVFHGGGGSPEQIEAHSGFTPVSEREGFVVVYPKGLNKQWNDGRKDDNRESDDLAFVEVLLKDLNSRLKIDAKRIFATGMSSGGFMSFLLGCERSEIFAAVAPVAATLSIGRLDHCAPEKPVSFFNIVGKNDTAVPYSGGRIKVLLGIKNRGQVLPSNEALQILLKANGCADKPKLALFDKIKTDKTSIEDARYTENCREKTEVRRLTVVGGEHAWPGHQPGHRRFLPAVVTSEEIDATAEIWNFFLAHPKL